MRAIAIFLITTFVWLFSLSHSAAKSSGLAGYKFRIAVHGGYSLQEFGGVVGANRSQINRFQYGVGAFYKSSWWENGLAFSAIPGVKVDPFVFRNGTQGQYQMDFTRFEFVTGVVYSRFGLYALVGLETIGWSGSPDLGAKNDPHLYFGAEARMNFYFFGPTSRFSAPLSIRYLSHPNRNIEFERNPDENITVSPGAETAFNMGVAVAF